MDANNKWNEKVDALKHTSPSEFLTRAADLGVQIERMRPYEFTDGSVLTQYRIVIREAENGHDIIGLLTPCSDAAMARNPGMARYAWRLELR
jgi:hypothetical protein